MKKIGCLATASRRRLFCLNGEPQYGIEDREQKYGSGSKYLKRKWAADLFPFTFADDVAAPYLLSVYSNRNLGRIRPLGGRMELLLRTIARAPWRFSRSRAIGAFRILGEDNRNYLHRKT